MIVQDKDNQLDYYGAVQFHTDGKRMSLAKYPGVTMKNNPWGTLLKPAKSVTDKVGGDDDMSKEFYYHGIKLTDGDWLVTDKEGHTLLYTDKKFKQSFVKKEGVE